PGHRRAVRRRPLRIRGRVQGHVHRLPEPGSDPERQAWRPRDALGVTGLGPALRRLRAGSAVTRAMAVRPPGARMAEQPRKGGARMTDTVSRRNGAARSTAFAALATAAMLPLLATGAAAQSWDGAVAAAREEGHVTIYTGTSHPIIEQEIEAFSAKYPGITFDLLDGEGPDLNSRIDQEIASGTPIVDMYISTDSQWITDANGRGIIAPLIGPAAQDFPQ